MAGRICKHWIINDKSKNDTFIWYGELKKNCGTCGLFDSIDDKCKIQSILLEDSRKVQ